MPFSEILGQETALATLKAALERDAVPQVYLFVGPESVGKTTTALAFVRALFGNTPVHNKRIGENQHPDLTRIARGKLRLRPESLVLVARLDVDVPPRDIASERQGLKPLLRSVNERTHSASIPT